MKITNEILHERLNNLININTKEHGEIKTRQDFTNGRLRTIERWKWTAVGAIAILNILVIPMLISFFGEQLFNH